MRIFKVLFPFFTFVFLTLMIDDDDGFSCYSLIMVVDLSLLLFYFGGNK